MGFKTIKITNKTTKKRKYKRRKTNNRRLKVFIIYLILGFFLMIGIGAGIIYNKFIKPLPDIKKLEELDIKESSKIYDKDGNELYTLFGDEKRTYVNYDSISKNMVNAIVAGEDKNFFTNPGIDLKGLIRAVFNYVTRKSTKIEGTSTISQQLIKNVFLSNERSYERKIKEAYLSYKMTEVYSKEKILELYLNKISFGSNAFGVEQASLTFFGKKASELSILEGSILASIPKGPTYYSPYTHFDRLVGYLYSYPKGDENSIINLLKKEQLDENESLVSKFETLVENLKGTKLGENGILICGLNSGDYKENIGIDKDGCAIMEYSELLDYLNSIQLENNGEIIEYQTGRKDFILGRMLEDGYITFEEYKTAILSSIGFKFEEYKENIKYPHFVLYVKEYLSNKYGEDLLETGGLKIYTTIDSKLQEKAEEIIKKQAASNLEKYDADNSALISIDNENGDILAYVGGVDYFNEEIDGNVDMINSKVQPGSSFKPFVYALAIDKNPIGTQTPIYDLKTKFGDWEPNNYDGKFNGKMNLMTALNYSRNIPAIKLYYLAGEQKGIINYLKTAGVQSFDEDFYYGAPMALGTAELKPIELVGAYSVFANEGNKIDINPIKKILDSNGLVIEQKKKTVGTKVLDEKTAYIMNYILSATYTRPNDARNQYLSLVDRQACAKTGTSNKTYILNGIKKILPGALWTAGYTPQMTTVIWAGNTDGKAMNTAGTGLGGAAPAWKEFMEFAHEGKEKLTWEAPSDLKYVKTSKISGLLAPEGFEPTLTASSLFKNIPTEYDNSLNEIQVDALCNGKVSENTPASAIKTGYYIAFHSIDPTNASWENSVQARAQKEGYKDFSNIPNIISNYEDKECERGTELILNSNIEVKSKIENNETFINGYNYVEIGYKSNNPIVKLQFLLGTNIIQEVSVANKKSGLYFGGINIPTGYNGDYKLTIRALDSIYMSDEEVKNIHIVSKDITGPEIIFTNPEKDSISIYEDQFFNLRGYLEDRTKIKVINIYLDGTPLKMGIESREFTQEISGKIGLGDHEITVEGVDLFFNKSSKTINVEVMQR